MQSQLGRVMQMTLSGQAKGLSTLPANSEIAAMDTLSSLFLRRCSFSL